METETLKLKIDPGEQSYVRCEREGNVLIFLATLIATLVLGATPDFDGLVSWFLAWRPLGSAGVRNVEARQE